VPKPLSKPALRRRALPAAAAALLPVLAACGGGSSSTTAQDSALSPDQSSPTSSITCDYPDAPQGATGNASKPPSTPDVQGTVDVTLTTSIGSLGAKLDAAKAPCTVNSFVSLARQGFFDKSPCHRLTTAAAGIYVLQCGDPTGTGSGGPGYEFKDDPVSVPYTRGTVAMANAGPNTNGSQFFIVLKDIPEGGLAPAYSVFGHVTKGMEAVDAIAAAADRESPTNPIKMDRVTVQQP